MTRRLTVAACALVAITLHPPSVAAQRGPTRAQPLRGLDAYVERAVEAWGIAGLSIAVVAGDSVVFAEGYGVRDVRDGTPVDAGTLFAIGSNTKLFTSVATGMLVDEGAIEWNDHVIEHLPTFTLHDPYASREMRIRDLLSHRSGLGRRGDLLWYGTDRSRDEILGQVRCLPPQTGFRSAFGYQNIMFLAAGEAAARAAGASWDELIQRRIFEPLGMEESTTSVVPLAARSNVAQPHLNEDGELVPVPHRNLDNIAPAGSIYSSAREMARWLRMILADGRFEGEQLVDSATLAEITSPHTIIPVSPDTLFPTTHFQAYGLGVVLQDYQGEKLAWHTGGIDGMLSLVAFLPERDVGLVVLSNTSGHNDLFTALMYRIVDAYLGAPTRDWSAILLDRLEAQEKRMTAARQGAREGRIEGTRPSLPLEAYAGTYHDVIYGPLEVRHEGDGLTLRLGPALAADLEHWHYDTFVPRWRRGSEIFGSSLSFVQFHVGAKGEPVDVRLQGLSEARFVRGNAPDGWCGG